MARRILIAITVLMITLATALAPAAASPPGDAEAIRIQSMLDDFKAANPGATQISPTTLRYPDGAEVTAGVDTEEGSCSYLNLCIWDQPNFRGNYLKFYYCRFYNIGYENGWSDKLRSFINDQSPRTEATFWNYYHGWQYLGNSIAYGESRIVSTFGVTDGITPCGGHRP
ncbi:peptidase inhibitor family I36 protein [Nonomuraea typhae]|uniref:peptidase inhibitor family I36 protein n=1 Tax=Nonomuraea typhae TaxID=2603600 RepID=UPI0012F73EB4|nr:peptidase inhibitor family I36 protein [Nonomuraea typhae]